MYMKDMMGNSISDDAEFDDLDDFDYVDQFIPKDEERDDSLDYDEDYDDLDDLYIDDEEEESEDFMEEKDAYENEDEEEEDIDDIDEELEAKFSCEDCGHKWYDYITETDDENDMFEISCPLCGSQNVTMER